MKLVREKIVRVLTARSVLLREAIAGRSGIDCAAGAQVSAELFANQTN
jgi:hypothetical protein